MNNLLFRGVRNLEISLHQLNYLFWECTTRCPLSCRHCGSDCYSESKNSDMPIEDFIEALDTIPQSEIEKNFMVVLTGGEPLARKDIADIGKELINRNLRWSIVSNALLYSKDKHKELVEAGISSITLSLDGLEDSHNWMRGNPKSFQKVIEAIDLINSTPSIIYDIVTCVNKKNIGELEAIYQLLKSKNVPQWRIFTISPIGRAKDDPLMWLSNSEFTHLMEFIKEKRSDKSSHINTIFSCEGYVGRYDQQVRRTPFFCRAGINIASILIDGTICACPNIDRNRFAQGNIYRDNFYSVWQNEFKVFRDKSYAKERGCSSCKEWKNCLGNGAHNWQEDKVLCHYKRIIQ